MITAKQAKEIYLKKFKIKHVGKCFKVENFGYDFELGGTLDDSLHIIDFNGSEKLIYAFPFAPENELKEYKNFKKAKRTLIFNDEESV